MTASLIRKFRSIVDLLLKRPSASKQQFSDSNLKSYSPDYMGKSRFCKFSLNGKLHESKEYRITGFRIMNIAGINSTHNSIWQVQRRGPDNLLDPSNLIDLVTKDECSFFTAQNFSTVMDSANQQMLPEKDRIYLKERGIQYEIKVSHNQTGIILTSYKLPQRKFDCVSTDILILLPPGYPDVSPDMFYCYPWLRHYETKGFPIAADVNFSFDNKNWQRWSRHNKEWRIGKDGIRTMIKRIDRALEEAF